MLTGGPEGVFVGVKVGVFVRIGAGTVGAMVMDLEQPVMIPTRATVKRNKVCK